LLDPNNEDEDFSPISGSFSKKKMLFQKRGLDLFEKDVESDNFGLALVESSFIKRQQTMRRQK
jgi:hypothetical protein